MRHTKESKMKNGIETMMIAVLFVVVLSLLFSIHVQSREADAAFTNTAYYQEQEKQYRKDCRKILDAYGCYDSGITMTRVVEADGRTYQIEIHNAQLREDPKPFEIYKHFKGNKYQVLMLATDSETKERVVVYQALYGDYAVYVRPLAMFLSETDHTKYPDAAQKYRFEKVEKKEDAGVTEIEESASTSVVSDKVLTELAKEEMDEEIKAYAALDPSVLAFLESHSYEDRLNILASLHDRITDDMINTMAVAIDVEIEPGDLEQRYMELKNCLLMKEKFERVRLS